MYYMNIYLYTIRVYTWRREEHDAVADATQHSYSNLTRFGEHRLCGRRDLTRLTTPSPPHFLCSRFCVIFPFFASGRKQTVQLILYSRSRQVFRSPHSMSNDKSSYFNVFHALCGCRRKKPTYTAESSSNSTFHAEYKIWHHYTVAICSFSACRFPLHSEWCNWRVAFGWCRCRYEPWHPICGRFESENERGWVILVYCPCNA